MYGAIIGDIVGSPWEFRRIKTKQFPLFGERNGVTGDSIMTVAVADALMNDMDPAETLREWGRRVLPAPQVAGYGKGCGKNGSTKIHPKLPNHSVL
jgi:ADP-ribosylglycohydrolase